MLTVPEALECILSHARPRHAAKVPLRHALGLVLAEEIQSDIDSPPFDKSIVDGYAVQAADLSSGRARLKVLEQVTAGDSPTLPVTAGSATRIMTGAPLPVGCDAVVMIEKTELVSTSTDKPGLPMPPAGGSEGAAVVEIRDTVRQGQNILRRGTAMRRGDVVLSAWHELRPAEIGLLCEVGRQDVLAIPRPTVAVLPTGNEIIDAGQTPAGGQIRNTNGPMLMAAVEGAGGRPVDLGVGRDDLDELHRLIARGLESDMLVLSGGVSAGVLDLVPRALADLGVQQVFHKVQFKPGKPLWFGVLPDERGDKLVFGLPGNPVSSLVCFEMFVRSALGRLAGRADAGMRSEQGELTCEFSHRGDRPTYHPARLRREGPRTLAEPLPWQGSADLRTIVSANGLVHFPVGDRRHAVGERLEVFWFA